MWKSRNTIEYYIDENFTYSTNIAIFSFIGTIVKNVSGPNVHKLKYLYKFNNIKAKLDLIHNNGGSIIIIDSFNSVYLENIKNAIDMFKLEMGYPIISFLSTKQNKYSKPFTGIWEIIEFLYKNKLKKIDLAKSIVIGNKAGRITLNKKKIDKSCLDRSFAHNIGIFFTTPDSFFLEENKFILWTWSPDIIDKQTRAIWANNATKIEVPIILDELNKLPISDNYTIIITGGPSCGKTTFAKKIKRKWDCDYKRGMIEYVSDNTLHIDELIANMIVLKNQSIIVDLTCYINNITKVIKQSMEDKKPILVLEIITNKPMLKLLDFIKVQQSKSNDVTICTTAVLNTYYSQYIKPDFKEIPCVRYIEFPLVINLSDAFWFEY